MTWHLHVTLWIWAHFRRSSLSHFNNYKCLFSSYSWLYLKQSNSIICCFFRLRDGSNSDADDLDRQPLESAPYGIVTDVLVWSMAFGSDVPQTHPQSTALNWSQRINNNILAVGLQDGRIQTWLVAERKSRLYIHFVLFCHLRLSCCTRCWPFSNNLILLFHNL